MGPAPAGQPRRRRDRRPRRRHGVLRRPLAGPDPDRIAVAALGLAAAGLTLALAVAGQPITALAAGASLGTAAAAAVEVTARLRCGRWLADPPAPPSAAPAASGGACQRRPGIAPHPPGSTVL